MLKKSKRTNEKEINVIAASNSFKDIYFVENNKVVSLPQKELLETVTENMKKWLINCDSLKSKSNEQNQRRSSRPPNPQLGGPRPTLGAQVSLKLLFGYVTIFSSADLFTTDLNCRKKLACDIISECNVILSRRI